MAQQLAVTKRPSNTELLAKLQQQRLEPLVPLMQTYDTLPVVSHWIVLPSAGLRGVPVEILAPKDTQISYCSSGTVLAWLRELRLSKPIPGNGLLALGDPVFSHLTPTEQRGLKLTPPAPTPLQLRQLLLQNRQPQRPPRRTIGLAYLALE